MWLCYLCHFLVLYDYFGRAVYLLLISSYNIELFNIWLLLVKVNNLGENRKVKRQWHNGWELRFMFIKGQNGESICIICNETVSEPELQMGHTKWPMTHVTHDPSIIS